MTTFTVRPKNWPPAQWVRCPSTDCRKQVAVPQGATHATCSHCSRPFPIAKAGLLRGQR